MTEDAGNPKRDEEDEQHYSPEELKAQIRNMEESPGRRLFWRIYGISAISLTAILVILLYADVFPPDLAPDIRNYAIFVFMALIVTFVIFRQKR